MVPFLGNRVAVRETGSPLKKKDFPIQETGSHILETGNESFCRITDGLCLRVDTRRKKIEILTSLSLES